MTFSRSGRDEESVGRNLSQFHTQATENGMYLSESRCVCILSIPPFGPQDIRENIHVITGVTILEMG